MSGQVLVVGQGLLGKALARQPTAKEFRFVSHREVSNPAILDGVDCVVNLALDPAYWDEPYRSDIDFDLRLASLIGNRPIHYVMASSRKVYGEGSAKPFTEDMFLCPVDTYGRNKAQTECALLAAFDGRLTILRISNVIGFDWQWDRRIFMGILLDSLRRQNRIVFDVSPFARRDFITDDAVGAVLAWAATARPIGMFNVGTGAALEIGKIALWVLAAYGKGDLVVTSPCIRDEFSIDISKLTKLFGPTCSIDALKAKCTDFGRHIAHA